jgi:hypothetical protein
MFSVLSLVFLIKPWELMGKLSDSVDSIQQFIGVCTIFIFLPVGVLIVSLVPAATQTDKQVLNRNSLSINEEKDTLISAPGRIKGVRYFHFIRSNNLFSLLAKDSKRFSYIVMFVLFPIILGFVFVLPPIWNSPFSSYAPVVSPFSWVSISLGSITTKVYSDSLSEDIFLQLFDIFSVLWVVLFVIRRWIFAPLETCTKNRQHFNSTTICHNQCRRAASYCILAR